MRPPPRRPEPPPLPGPILPGQAAEFANLELGSHGEMLPMPKPEPAQIVETAFTIEPPNWELEERERRERDAGQPEPSAAPTMTAVEAMYARANELGELEELPPVGPPLRYPPFERFVPPPVDWEKEQAEAVERQRQAERERRAELLRELLLDEDLVAYPRKKGKP